MSLTTRIKIIPNDVFDLQAAISEGQISITTDKHLALLSYDVPRLAGMSVIEVEANPVTVANNTIYHNTTIGQIYFGNNNQLINIGTMLRRSGVNVIARVTSLPASPVEGDPYIIGRRIAEFTGGEWSFTFPVMNQVVGVENEYSDYSWNGKAWIKIQFPWIVTV